MDEVLREDPFEPSAIEKRQVRKKQLSFGAAPVEVVDGWMEIIDAVKVDGETKVDAMAKLLPYAQQALSAQHNKSTIEVMASFNRGLAIIQDQMGAMAKLVDSIEDETQKRSIDTIAALNARVAEGDRRVAELEAELASLGAKLEAAELRACEAEAKRDDALTAMTNMKGLITQILHTQNLQEETGKQPTLAERKRDLDKTLSTPAAPDLGHSIPVR